MGDETLSREQVIAIGRELLDHLNGHREPLTVTNDRVASMAHGPMVDALSAHAPWFSTFTKTARSWNPCR